MIARLRSPAQLMPFATAGELVRSKRRALASISSGVTAVGALRVMQRENIGFLPVLDEGRLVGVVSERDIARGAMLEQHVFVRELMTTRAIHTVAPDADVNVCLALMHRARIRHLPVVSGATILGVVSVRDLMGSLVERHERLLHRLEQERVTLLFPYSSSY
jgi:CBS domain-containing protein